MSQPQIDSFATELPPNRPRPRRAHWPAGVTPRIVTAALQEKDGPPQRRTRMATAHGNLPVGTSTTPSPPELTTSPSIEGGGGAAPAVNIPVSHAGCASGSLQRWSDMKHWIGGQRWLGLGCRSSRPKRAMQGPKKSSQTKTVNQT
jgi:hypothetical protein